eukprot:TRINITY_DN8963_c0_g1_i1.p1 TRINITY_DN8963_c0_g1~~TRINITY_DN8963_c0_g1_i1.p1  ORF type:complete len:374 (+),score=95.95 TRINITY_DN8963_c0_g1_i1:82-1203(+)
MCIRDRQKPAVDVTQRLAILGAIRFVDEVFIEESLELKKEYCIKYGADVLVMGSDHLNEYDEMLAGVCECEYLPRTEFVSSTGIKHNICMEQARRRETLGAAETPPQGQQKPDRDAYGARSKNLVHATTQSTKLTEFLVEAHDRYYDWVMDTCTPFCAAMPRDVTLGGHKWTVFTANTVTYTRGFLAIPIALGCKYGWLSTAAFLVMFHDFLDHLDGVVAKQQARDGRSKGDDGMWGAFVDAQMDKLVFCLCLWSFLLTVSYNTAGAGVQAVVVLTCATLFGLEFAIGAVRTQDYFTARLQPADGIKPALRAVSEGKLKQKFESTGIAVYCLSLPDPASNLLVTVIGTLCLWFAAYFSIQSLMHKLRARAHTE